jgi:hypothetical protein
MRLVLAMIIVMTSWQVSAEDSINLSSETLDSQIKCST